MQLSHFKLHGCSGDINYYDVYIIWSVKTRSRSETLRAPRNSYISISQPSAAYKFNSLLLIYNVSSWITLAARSGDTIHSLLSDRCSD